MFRKIHRYEICSGVAAHYVKSIVVCKLCVVQNETLFVNIKHLCQDARCNNKDHEVTFYVYNTACLIMSYKLQIITSMLRKSILSAYRNYCIHIGT
jgi:hypothetical protein